MICELLNVSNAFGVVPVDSKDNMGRFLCVISAPTSFPQITYGSGIEDLDIHARKKRPASLLRTVYIRRSI